VVANDPLYVPAFNNVIFAYVQTRDVDKADELIRRVERIAGESPDVLFARGALTYTEGRLAEAVEILAKSYEFNRSGSVRQLWYGSVLSLLGEYDTAAEVMRDTDKLVPLELAGRHDAALEVFDSLQLLYLGEGNLRGIGEWMLLDERPDDYIAFLEKQAVDGADFIDSQPRPEELWGASHFTSLAYALRETGRNAEASRVMAETKAILDAQAKMGADNLFYWYNKAEFDALAGDVESMLTNMRKAMNSGNADVAGFFTAPFNRYRSDSRFIEIDEEARRRGNAERQKLGLEKI